MSLTVVKPGFMTTVQDLGRAAAHIGVPRGGAMDRYALAAANRLVNNSMGAAGLEFVLEAPVLLVERDCLIAAAGGGFRLIVNGEDFPLWMAIFARRGSTIRLEEDENGTWGYLAVSGGLDVPPVMGSRGTYLRAGLGGWQGRTLHSGDRLPLGAQRSGDLSRHGGRLLPVDCLPGYHPNPTIRCIQGAQWDAFTEAGQATFCANAYQLTMTADRMGYRLEGAPVGHVRGADILSEGMAVGAVQVPVNGQPIVMMSDCQTAGGYTKIGVVILADQPVLAQCRPGESSIRFEMVEIETAQQAYRQQMDKMLRGIDANRDDQIEASRF